MQKITPFFLFRGQAEEAMNHYVSIFKNSKILDVSRYGDAGPGPKGDVMMVRAQIEGQEFVALNADMPIQSTEAVSFHVDCETQVEVDELWGKLTSGGKEIYCGWLVDKFGIRWQIIPKFLSDALRDPDPAKVARVMKAMMGMVKIDVAGLKRAYEGE
jgi:predicted 3-demethylubiquinone-9 3-methyltransferase (glyoxalase superfamily)